MDEAQGFQGAQDRYSFKLVGKKEIFIPYNNFRTFDASLCPAKVVLTKNHYNPDCLRWELHRVWVVEAELKPGFRHIYPRRTLYFDEDVPGAGVTENYDAAGRVYRVDMVTYTPYYESQGILSDQFMTMDLQTGSWYLAGEAADTGGYYQTPSKGDRYYTPEAVAAEGIR